MKILVNGAGGRMGRVLCGMIEKGCRNAELAGMVDARAAGEGILPSLGDFTGEADCVVDFSHHTAAKELADYAVSHRCPLVVATTGQTDGELALLREASASAPVFLSGNMSMGIALLSELARQTAKAFPDADIEIVEAHHNQKLDVPSGTALMLAKSIQSVRPDAELVVGRHENGKRKKQEIGIHSLRLGGVVGVHEILVDTGTQTITLKHEARDRALFAEGALAAAEFLIGKAPGFYDMNDLVHTI